MDNFAIKENSLESKIDTIREDLKTMKNSIDTLGSEIIGIKSIEEKILEQLISMNNKFSGISKKVENMDNIKKDDNSKKDQ